jgi:predicted RNA-binding Zn-ribbon protein involved in translation (DUF1610 family)
MRPTTAMTRLQCPKCGAEMNRHAEKLVYAESAAELLEEIHACPRCGNVESRRVALAGWPGAEQDRVTPAP